MAPRVAIITYSMYGHIAKLAESIKAGVESAGKGANATIYQIAETLPEEVLAKMHAPPKPAYPVIQPAELWKAFWDATGGLWAQGALYGKYAGVFVSTGTLGGGQEMTASSAISTLTHHGIIFVPLGYKNAFGELANLNEIHGGSPWGAGTFAGPDGSRQPTALELKIAEIQGKSFYETVAKAFP
ncbi:NAD(P)H:quinone oxidoreductase, type IV [Ceratobasidium sp. AG-Ba]|nr:NAD(P)H:quinone oxidoreductase, type IV [Ceratobasidium sp. AG-Ba]